VNLFRGASLIVALLLLTVAPSAFALDEQSGSPDLGTPPTVYSPDGVIVQWAPSADRGDRAAAREDADVDSQSDLGRSFQLVEVEPRQTPAEAIAALEADPAVLLAERDGYIATDAIPNDPLFNHLWGLRNLGLGVNGFSGAIAGDDINAISAWDRTVGSPSTVIADLDSGYRFEHPDLGPVTWTNPGEIAGNSADDDGNGFVDDVHGWDFVGANGEAIVADNNPTDDDLLTGGHGVHTAGTLGAAGNNGVGIAGVSRNVRIMPLRICTRFPALQDGRCPISAEIAGINYAGKMGARAANMSLGGTGKETAVANALAANPKTLFVISAGNDGENNDTEAHHYPCDFNPAVDASPAVPGAIDNVLCVAATDQADGLASFSNYGATSVDVGAPGTETLSTYPFFFNFEDHFTVNDFASNWAATGANGGFTRTNEAPLTSFGMTDSVGAATPGTVREVTSRTIAIPANAGCRLTQTRRVVLGSGDQYRYSVLLNGVEQNSSLPASTPTAGLEGRFLDLATSFKAGGNVQIRFRYTAGSASGGIWLDDIVLRCSEAIGASTGYGFLQGTSMATPHVTGAAGLLFSLKPSASVTEVKNALLTSGDLIGSLSGKTTTGRRLDVNAALAKLVPVGTETVAPETTILSGPEAATTSTTASIGFARTDADAGAFECSLDGSAFSPCASPASYMVGLGAHQFQVRAKGASGLVDPTPAVRFWTVSSPPPPPPPPPSCKVPKLAGKSLAQAKSALSAANCTLGKVTKPKAKKGKKLPALVVKSSTPAAGVSTSGKVDLKLGKKPKPKHKHH
jgi:subtilisin family serine protease